MIKRNEDKNNIEINKGDVLLLEWGEDVEKNSDDILSLIKDLLKKGKKCCLFSQEKESVFYSKGCIDLSKDEKSKFMIFDKFFEASDIFDEIMNSSKDGFEIFIVENERKVVTGDLISLWYKNLNMLAKNIGVAIVMIRGEKNE